MQSVFSLVYQKIFYIEFWKIIQKTSNFKNFLEFLDETEKMEEITMKKIALLRILICSIELTNWKKSDMLVEKTENEGCLRNKNLKEDL